MLRAIGSLAFDLEGTLVDLERQHHLGHLAAARELGLKLSLGEALQQLQSFLGGPDKMVAKELQRLSGADASVEFILSRIQYHYASLQHGMVVRPRPGVRRFLCQAEASGYKMALASVTERKKGQALLRKAGLTKFFRRRVQVFLEDVKSAKPAPDVYLETARRNKTDPVRQLVFEDSPVGVRSAWAAGSTVIAIPAVHTEVVRRALLRAGAIAVIPQWTDVTPAQILSLLKKRL
jgi:beta-phosphoglucomutase